MCEQYDKDHVSKVGIIDMLSNTKSKDVITLIYQRNMVEWRAEVSHLEHMLEEGLLSKEIDYSLSWNEYEGQSLEYWLLLRS